MLREVYRSLCNLHMRIKAARRTTDNRGRAEFVRGLVERIECTFEHRHVNGKKAGRLSKIRFVPWSGEPLEYCTGDASDTGERAPRRWLTSMLTREYTSIEIEEESQLAR